MPLAKPNEVHLPPFHLKLSLVKNFVKAMNHHGEAFKHTCELFPYMTEEKFMQGIFVGQEIQKLLKDQLLNI